MIVYHTFRPTATIISTVQPNEDHHWNHKEILNQTGGGDIPKIFHHFLCIRPLSKKVDRPFFRRLFDENIRNHILKIPTSGFIAEKSIKPEVIQN